MKSLSSNEASVGDCEAMAASRCGVMYTLDCEAMAADAASCVLP